MDDGELGMFTFGPSSGGLAAPIPAAIPLDGIAAVLEAPYNAWPLAVVQSAVGNAFTCLLLNTGNVTCFGSNSAGQCADDTSVSNHWGPDSVVELPSRLPAVQVCTGFDFACALLVNGSAACWGKNDRAQLGTATWYGASSAAPLLWFRTSTTVYTQISCGYRHTCGLRADGNVDCAGNNVWYQVDSSSSTRDSSAITVTSSDTINTGTSANSGVRFTSLGLSPASLTTCGTLSNGRVRCWGMDSVSADGQHKANGRGSTGLRSNGGPATSPSFPNTDALGSTYLPFPLVQDVTAAPRSYLPGGSNAWTALVYTVWVPYDRTGGRPLQCFLNAVPADTSTQLNATAFLCLFSPDAMLRVGTARMPARASLSSTGAPAGWLYSVDVCPRPIFQPMTVTGLDTASPGRLALTGSCLSTDVSQWAKSGSVTLTATQGGKALTVVSSNASVLVVQLLAGTGSAEIVVSSTFTKVATSVAGQMWITFAPPEVYNATGSRATPISLKSTGDTMTINGRYFGSPSASPAVVVTVAFGNTTCASPVLVSDLRITCTVPAGTGTDIPVSVTINGVASTGVTISYEAPTLTSITPTYTWAQPGVNTIVVLRGTLLGASAADIAGVWVGGVACPAASITWYNATTLRCFNVSTANMAPGDSTAVVGLTSGVNLTVPYTVFANPRLTAIVPSTTSVGNWVALVGAGLGATTATGVLGAVAEVGLQQITGVNATRLPCSASRISPTSTGTTVFCQLPNGDTNATYVPYVALYGGPVVVGFGSTFNFLAVPTLTVSWYQAVDGAALALPSSVDSVYLLSPRLTVVATTPAGGTPATPVTCMLQLDTASLPSSDIQAFLAGNSTMSASVVAGITGMVANFSIGIIGVSNATYSLTAQCSFGGAPPWYPAPGKIRARLAALELAWDAHPSNATWPSSVSGRGDPGVVIPMSPPPTVSLWSTTGSRARVAILSAASRVACSVTAAAVSLGDVALATGTTSVYAAANASAMFDGIGIAAPMLSAYTLTATCAWITGEEFTATSYAGRVVNITVGFAAVSGAGAAPPTTFTYNSPTTNVSARLYYTAAGGSITTLASQPAVALRSIDTTCTMAASTAVGAMAFGGGTVTALNPVTGAVAMQSLYLQPPYALLPDPATVTMTMTCTFRAQPMPSITFTSRMQTLSLAWTALPPVAVTPSASTNTYTQAAIAVGLYNESGALMVGDFTATCGLAAAAGWSAAGVPLSNQAMSVDLATTAVAVAGIATFGGWSLTAPIGSVVTLGVTCTRAEGGPSLFTAVNVSTRSADALWINSTTVDATFPSPLYLYDTPYVVTARLWVRTPTSRSSTAVYTTAPYSTATAPVAACSIGVDGSADAAAGAVLSGDPAAYTGAPVSTAGYVSFTVRLTATAGIAVPLKLTCSYGDNSIGSPLYYVQVASVVASFVITVTSPPPLFTYNTPTVNTTVAFFAVVPGNDTLGVQPRQVAISTSSPLTTSDIACTPDAELSRTGANVLFTGGAVSPLNLAAGTVTPAPTSLSPSLTGAGQPGNVTVSLTCAFRKAAVPPARFATLLQNMSVVWVTPPPATAMSTMTGRSVVLPPVQVALVNQTGAVVSTDNTATCTLGVARATTASGATVSKQALSVDGGVVALAVAGRITFSSWTLTAPLASNVVLQVLCNRAEGGFQMVLTAPIAMQSAEVQWVNASSLETASGLPVVMWDAPFAVAAVVLLRIPTSATNASAYTLAPYSAAGAPAASCTVAIDTTALAGGVTATLTGDGSGYTAVPVLADGSVRLAVQLTGTPGAAIPLVLGCTFGDATISSAGTVRVTVASLALSWFTSAAVAPPPTSFVYNRLAANATAQLLLTLPGNGTIPARNVALPPDILAQLESSDATCSVAAESYATGSQRTVPYSGGDVAPLDAANATVVLSGLALQPPYEGVTGGIDTSVTLTCLYRALAVAPVTYTAYMQNLTLAWITLPPVYLQACTTDVTFYQPDLLLEVLDQYGVGLSSDNSTACVLSAGAGVTTAGVALTLQQMTALGGLSAVAVNGFVRFTNWALSAPLRSSVVMRVECTRVEGGPLVVATAPVAVASADVAWVAANSLDPTGAALTAFYDTPANVTARVWMRTPVSATNASNAAYTVFNTSTAPATACTLQLDAGSLAAAGVTASLGGDPLVYQSVPVNATGFVTFPLRLVAPARTPIKLVVQCLHGDTLVESPLLPATLTSLNPRWVAPPPRLLLASSTATDATLVPLPGAIVVSVHDDYGTLVTDDDALQCSMAVAAVGNETWGSGAAPFAADWAVPSVALSGDSALGATAVGGVAVFPDLSVATALGTQVAFTVTCSRVAGGAKAEGTNTSLVASARVTWNASALPPARVLYDTAYEVAAVVELQADAGAAWAWQPYNATDYLPTVCTLTLTDADQDRGVALGGGALAQRAAVGDDGTVAFTLRVQGQGTPGVFVRCVIAGSVVTSPVAVTTVDVLRAVLVVPPQDRWLPSSNAYKVPVAPPPLVRITNSYGAAVDGRGVSCFVTINTTAFADDATWPGGITPRLLDPPEQGYQYNAGVDGMLLDGVNLNAGWGASVPLAIACTRPQGDTIAPTTWTLRTMTTRLEWLDRPPAFAQAGLPFTMSAAIVDGDVGGNLTLDNATVCRVSSSVLVQQGAETAAVGLLEWPSVTLLGWPDVPYDLHVSCALGDVVHTSTLTATLTIAPCAAGTEPSGDTIISCVSCPENTYSDGGSGECVTCPYGVTCSGGMLTLLPGYYLALPAAAAANPAAYNISYLPDGRVLAAAVSEATELHSCWNSEACVVNSTDRTYGCAPGYSGVLCGVCDGAQRWVRQGGKCIPCASWEADYFVLALIAVFFFAVLVYVSLVLDFSRPSQSKSVWRILINYMSVLGSYVVYVAHGTDTFSTAVSSIQAILVPGSGTGMNISPVQCELQLTYYERYAAIIFFPAAAVLACVAINVIAIAWYTACSRTGPGFVAELKAFWRSQKPLAVGTLVLFMAYPSMTAQAFTMFPCRPEAIGGVHYLVADIGVSCDTTQHALGLSFSWAVVFFLCAGMPLAFVWWLWRHDTQVRAGASSNFFRLFGFLYQGYRTDAWYLYGWESLAMLRKAFVVAVAATTTDPVYQVGALQLLLFTAFCLQMHFAPYDRPLLNYLEAMTLAALILTQAINMMYQRTLSLQEAAASLTSTPAVLAEQTGYLEANPSPLTVGSASALTLVVNVVAMLVLLVTYVRLRRAELMKGTGVWDMVADCLGVYRRRPDLARTDCETTMALAVASDGGGAALRKFSSSRSAGRVATNPPAGKTREGGPPPPPPHPQPPPQPPRMTSASSLASPDGDLPLLPLAGATGANAKLHGAMRRARASGVVLQGASALAYNRMVEEARAAAAAAALEETTTPKPTVAATTPATPSGRAQRPPPPPPPAPPAPAPAPAPLPDASASRPSGSGAAPAARSRTAGGGVLAMLSGGRAGKTPLSGTSSVEASGGGDGDAKAGGGGGEGDGAWASNPLLSGMVVRPGGSGSGSRRVLVAVADTKPQRAAAPVTKLTVAERALAADADGGDDEWRSPRDVALPPPSARPAARRPSASSSTARRSATTTAPPPAAAHGASDAAFVVASPLLAARTPSSAPAPTPSTPSAPGSGSGGGGGGGGGGGDGGVPRVRRGTAMPQAVRNPMQRRRQASGGIEPDSPVAAPHDDPVGDRRVFGFGADVGGGAAGGVAVTAGHTVAAAHAVVGTAAGHAAGHDATELARGLVSYRRAVPAPHAR